MTRIPPPLALLVALVAHATGCSPHAPASSSGPPAGTQVSAVNETDTAATVFVAFGSDSVVKAADWAAFCTSTAALNCSFPLAAHAVQGLPAGGRYLNATLAFNAPVGCGATKAEVNANNPNWYDTVDVSLVDGFNERIQVVANGSPIGPPRGATGNERVYGVYPMGCDICVARQNPPCGIAKGTEGCKTGTQSNPTVPCQYQGPTKGGGGTVIVTLLGKGTPAVK